MKKSFWAARPFGYGEQFPMLDVGQVIEIEVGQQRNDEKLIRLGLLREANEKPVPCGKCGAKFLNDGYLDQHGRRHHAKSYVEMGRDEASAAFNKIMATEAQLGVDNPRDREVPSLDLATAEAAGRLRAVEEADRFAEQSVPLNLDKTKASLEASRGRRASR